MVDTTTRWVLTHTTIDPLVIATAFNIPEQDCWEYLADLDNELAQYAKERDENAIRQEAKEWANALSEAYEVKRKILLQRLKEATTEQEKKERLVHYKLFTDKLSTLSPDQIQKARRYPIEQLLNTDKKMIKCIFHDDKTASMNIKNNFYHCHGCGVSGDTISLVMKRDGLIFKEAVIKLT